MADTNMARQTPLEANSPRPLIDDFLKTVTTGEDDMEPQYPQAGDVLVSKPTETVEHEICVVPGPPHVTCANHDRAVAEGRQLAQRLKVDAWLTEDHCHFLAIGRYREGRPGPSHHLEERPSAERPGRHPLADS
jgi:hypothetical protein